MKKEQKGNIIIELEDSIRRSQAGVITSYQKLPTPELVKLRHKLKESGVEFRVIKNTLARRAADGAGKGFLSSHLEGPIAMVIGFDDVTAPARALTEYVRASGISMALYGGFLSDRWLSDKEVNALAALPGRDVLLGKVLGGLVSPIIGLVNSLTSPMLGIVWALQARINQMEAK